jgi:hypothetical protein
MLTCGTGGRGKRSDCSRCSTRSGRLATVVRFRVVATIGEVVIVYIMVVILWGESEHDLRRRKNGVAASAGPRRTNHVAGSGKQLCREYTVRNKLKPLESYKTMRVMRLVSTTNNPNRNQYPK